jgi:nitrate/TMAO reductase-like tetraheme cytochrome c subunit
MPTKRVIQAGHILAMVFIALLLAGARGFLGAHPVLSGVLLALVAPVYYVAARVSGHRQFLHPASLLAVLGFQLVVYGAGVPIEFQPLVSLVPVGLLFLIASRGLLKRIEDGSLSLYGAINFIIGAFTLWTLLRLSAQFAAAPWATALALAGYAVYAWLRFLRTEKAAYVLTIVVLGSAAFFFLLYHAPAIALGLGAAAGLLVMADLFRRRMVPRLEAAAFTVVGAYLIFMAVTGARATQIPLGYLVLAGTWLHLGLVLHRPELPPLAGPHPAPLPRLLPLFGAGMVLALVPVALFYPWTPVTLPVPYLAVFFVMFLATSRELAKQSFSLIGVVLARVLALLARLAPLAALVYLIGHRFPASYRIGLAALAVAALSLLAAWRQVPRILGRRNLYAYQAAAFLAIAYFVAERRLALAGVAGTLLDSGALLVLALAALALALRSRAAPAFLTTLYEAACLPAAVACVLQVRRGELGLQSALLLGGLLVAACGIVFARVRRPAVVFTLPVVLGLWIYVAEYAAGARGEMLGLPYLIFGFASAGLGYVLLRRGTRWHELFYFMWFLCTAVSLVLFYPLRAEGAYAAPLWPIAFLLVGRAVAARRDLPFAVALEALSALLAASSLLALVVHGLYLQTAVALIVYAALYAWMALGRRVEEYLYPAALCGVAGYFFGVMFAGGEQLFLAYLFPLAAVMYLIAAFARRRGFAQHAPPLELAAGIGAIVGALLFLSLPFASHTTTGVLTGAAYVAIYAAVSALTRNRVFVTGMGLAGAFAFYEFLPLLPKVNSGNRLAFFVPVALLLILLGRRQHRAQDPRGAWGLYAAAIVVTALASVFAMWPQPADPGASRVVLLVAIAIWPVLLIWTANEIFIYCGTLGIAMLAYHFVQSSADMFGQHLVAFFLFGTALLGLVFVAATVRKRVRFRRPLLLVAPAHWYDRLVYLVPVAVLGIATFGSWGVSSSSNPHFCGTCHNMGTYFASWKKSPHARADVSCASCHYDPGLTGFLRAKMKGTSQLVATLTQSASNRPEAQVSNETCLRSGCHSSDQLARPVALRTVRFQHQQHLGALARGPQLRCTSCHTSVDPERHFAVDTNACFTCHFHATSAPASVGKAGCVACHGVPQKNAAFDHVSAGVKPEDQACASCHEKVVSGSPAVEPRQCRHCHIERAAQLLAAGTADIHRRHVMGQGVGCDWCHGAVAHGQLDRTAATD